MADAKIDEDYLGHLIEQRYPEGQGYVTLRQVRNATGYSRVARTADAIVMGMWPSRGLEISGFEIKTSRSDFLAEMRDPKKADAIARYCDYWWLVVSGSDVAKARAVPKLWGLLTYQESTGKLRQTKAALHNGAATPLDRLFVASLLRSASRQNPDPNKNAMSASYRRGHVDGAAQEKKKQEGAHNRRHSAAEHDLDALRHKVERFEKEAGVDLSGWTYPKHIGRIASALVKGNAARTVAQLDAVQETLKLVSDQLADVLTASGVDVLGRKGQVPPVP